MTDKTITMTLKPTINRDNQLILRVLDGKGGEGPFTSLTDLAKSRAGIKAMTVEVCDFYRERTIYRVYGAVLGEDGETVTVHWQPNEAGNGQRHTFAVNGAASPSFVVGARPARADVSEPDPFVSDAAGGRTDVDHPLSENPPKGN